MDEYRKILSKYVPENAVLPVIDLLNNYPELYLKITRARTTKLGDFRIYHAKKQQITVNHNLNKYQFLLTLLHEIAHFITYKNNGRKVKPHGAEWKLIYGSLIKEYLNYDAFPENLKDDLYKYANNPKASTSGDGMMFIKLSEYDNDKDERLKYVLELEKGTIFAMDNGEVYRLGEKRRTRYKCINLKNNKTYLVTQNARVLPIKNEDL